MSCVNRREVIYWGAAKEAVLRIFGAQRVLKIARRADSFQKDLVLAKRDDDRFNDGENDES